MSVVSDGLVVEGLTVEYPTAAGIVRGADAISLTVRPGQRLGIVGESGSGKSTTALAILRLIRPPGRVAKGHVLLNGTNLLALDEARLRAARLRLASYIPQGAMNSLNPVLTVAAQLRDAAADHGAARDRRAMQALIEEALEGVDLPARSATLYPHQLSGGMKQRVCIAIGMLLRPQLIIADEPTSALDVVTQRQVMATLGRRQAETGSCLILIGHDMGLMAQFVDTLAVMYAGRIVEMGPVAEMFRAPRHPYTRLLIESVPTFEQRGHFVGIPGTAPALTRLPAGCSFAPRCRHVMEICRQERPAVEPAEPGRVLACHLEAKAHVGTD
jgi:oligopeptide/dipeptide ABC transporter ATP-binding protein